MTKHVQSQKDKANSPANGGKLSYEQFFRKLIPQLRKGEYKGVHLVYSGIAAAFRKYFGFPEVDTAGMTKEQAKLARAAAPDRVAFNQLVAQGKLVTIPCRGGAMVYLPEDAPQGRSNDRKADEILALL
jgi:hypothetical protein